MPDQMRSFIRALALLGLSPGVILAGATQGMSCATINADTPTPSKPSIFLSFERSGPREPIYNGEGHEGVWLRLYNNTEWAISFCTESLYLGDKTTPLQLHDGRAVLGLRHGTEVAACYWIEETETARPNHRLRAGFHGDVSSMSWLPPGRSVVIGIPRENLSKGRTLFINFNYEWETTASGVKPGEPEHRVYFPATTVESNYTGPK
jgi:hypothetical protein